MNRLFACVTSLVIVIFCVIDVTSAVRGAEASAQSRTTKPPNIVFIFSDDHAYQAISALQRSAPADRNAAHRSPGQGGDAFRPVRRAELDLRAQPRIGLDR